MFQLKNMTLAQIFIISQQINTIFYIESHRKFIFVEFLQTFGFREKSAKYSEHGELLPDLIRTHPIMSLNIFHVY